MLNEFSQKENFKILSNAPLTGLENMLYLAEKF